MAQPIRVAILGGGLAGACLAHALLKHPNLDTHIFESSPEFKEAGVAVGLARNALKALDLIGPSAVQALEKAGAVPQKRIRLMLAQGDQPGVQVDEAKGHVLASIVQRATFLRELLAIVPPERMHASKKLERVDRDGNEGQMTLNFADGTSHHCDILIGADGIHSTVRKIILGESDSAAQPRNAGWWAVMALKPLEEAQAVLGQELVDAQDPSEVQWAGAGAFLMHNVLSDGQLVQLAVSGRDDAAEGSAEWRRMVSVEELRELFATWPPHMKNAVEKLLCDQPQQPAIYLWEHPPARTYVSGSMCVMGDAAHATTPWQGSGAGMSVEDALILSSLLGRAKSITEAVKALEVYDQVRRPRTQKIVKSSRETGLIATGRGEKTGLELEKLKQDYFSRWDLIIDLDTEKHLADAVVMYDEIR